MSTMPTNPGFHSTAPMRLTRIAAAVVAAWCSPAIAAGLAANALPTGASVVAGNVSLSTAANVLTVDQGSARAIVNFSSFNIGSAARVDVRQPGSSSALLARTTGGDPSRIEGRINANGSVWLINPAGILVGADARIDVGQFVGSSLQVNDADFLANRASFHGGDAAGAVSNLGRIQAHTGGSVYLVGSSVDNSGIIEAPNGEAILAAGRTVELVDTATPGVSVAITGSAGSATNLGRISAEAGRIGLAAGLVTNAGSLDASSVVREGGRIFLRAAKDLQTTATSTIDANGTSGGSVSLYADGAAAIDGSVSALGSAGKGGFVETSGRQSLEVGRVPRIGSDGEWLIDPFSIQVVAGDGGLAGAIGDSAIVSTETGATISASTIAAQLSAGINVSLSTGPGNPLTDTDHGDITVAAPINKVGANVASLTLNASNNIIVAADITSTGSPLHLALNSNAHGDYAGVDHAVQVNANIDLNGGLLSAREGLGGSNPGAVNIGAGGAILLNQATSTLAAGDLNLQPGGSLTLGGGSLALTGSLNNAGLVNVYSGTLALTRTGVHSGEFFVAIGARLSMANGQTFAEGSSFDGSGDVEWSGHITIDTPLLFGGEGNRLALHDTLLDGTSLLSTMGRSTATVDGAVSIGGSLQWLNSGQLAVTGSGSIHVASDNALFRNNVDGVVTTSGTTLAVLGGSGNGNFVNDGTLQKSGPSPQQYADLTNSSSGAVNIGAGTLTMSGAMGGQFDVAAGAAMVFSNASFDASTAFSGAGSMVWSDSITLGSALDLATTVPALSIGPATVIASRDEAAQTLTTRNPVTIAGGTLDLRNGAIWNNLGSVTIGGADAGALNVLSSAAFNNASGATLALAANGSVNVAAGGVLTDAVDATFAGDGLLSLQGGSATLQGATRLARFSMSSGSLQSSTGLSVTQSFAQTGGTLQLGDAALNEAAGDLVVGDITATNLLLRSQDGAIRQTGALQVATQLVTSSAAGTVLDASANRIAAAAMNNRGNGDIVLVNQLAPGATALTVTGIANAHGSISVDSHGALVTAPIGNAASFLDRLSSSIADPRSEPGFAGAGQVSAANGSVTLFAHSPLTIGSGGVSAAGDITLTAGDSGAASDILSINGAVTSSAGNIALSAGQDIVLNAAVTTARPGVVSATAIRGSVTPPLPPPPPPPPPPTPAPTPTPIPAPIPTPTPPPISPSEVAAALANSVDLFSRSTDGGVVILANTGLVAQPSSVPSLVVTSGSKGDDTTQTGTAKTDTAKADTDKATAKTDTTQAKDQPAKKMYCN